MAKSSGQATNTAAPPEDKLGVGQPGTFIVFAVHVRAADSNVIGDSKSTFEKLKDKVTSQGEKK